MNDELNALFKEHGIDPIPQPAMPNDLLSVRDIAMLIGVKRHKVYALAHLFGPPVVVGTSHLYPRRRVIDVCRQAAEIAAAATANAMPNGSTPSDS